MTESEYIGALWTERKRGANHAQLRLALCKPLRSDYDQATRTQFGCIESEYSRGFMEVRNS